MTQMLIIVAFSYLIGSIPFGYILVRFFHGQDIRESGSGNIGATNVSRSSPVLGLVTLLLDAGKGSVAVVFAVSLGWILRPELTLPSSDIAIRASIAAFCAVLGHMFPLWLKFRGGKGVATGLGAFIILAPKAALLAIGIFVAVVLIFRYVSLGSIFAVAIFPLLVWLSGDYHGEPLVLAFISAATVLIVLKHYENIGRLIHGTESRFQLRRG